MPIYEYRCRGCGRKNALLVLNISQPPPPVCRYCGGTDLEKLVSRIAILRSDEDRLEHMADSADLSAVDENDPRSVSRWMKKMGREMGEDLGEEMGEDLDRPLEETAGGDEAPDRADDEGQSGPGESD